MGVLHRHCLLVSALIAAAMILGGGQARAGYVSATALELRDGLGSLSLLVERVAPAGMAGAGETSLPQSDTDDPHDPSGLLSRLCKRPFAAHDTAHRGNAGNSSPSDSRNGPSSSPAGDLLRPQTPLLEFTCLIPPQTGDAHPFSLPSDVFHPPRAA